jgi:hypothetical protein
MFSPLLLILVLANFAKAAEPAYCQLQSFQANEIKIDTNGLSRAKAFKLGKVTIVGLGVGNSNVAQTKKMATTLGNVNQSSMYCTWYFNDGNDEAGAAFRHVYLNRPTASPDQVRQEYMSKLSGEFGKNALSMVGCAQEHGYMAMGCDGMKHRGPTVFGMLLSYSGCSPQKAVIIANTLWGENTIKPEARIAAAQGAFELATQEPVQSATLQALFLNQ